MKKPRRTANIFVKAEWLKEHIFKEYKYMSNNELLKATLRCWRFSYGFRQKLPPEDFKLLEAIKTSGVSPQTAFRWFQATLMPSDIREKLEEGSMSMRKAEKTFKDHNKRVKSMLEIEILED